MGFTFIDKINGSGELYYNLFVYYILVMDRQYFYYFPSWMFMDILK